MVHSPSARYRSFTEFWPFYVSQHRRPLTRWLHFIGTVGVFPLLLLGIWASPWWFLAMPLCGYGFAWLSHFTVEHNRPATFEYPLWSFLADFKMAWLMITFDMQRHLELSDKHFAGQDET